MPRPTSVRSKLLGVFDDAPRASAFTVAQRLGVPFQKAREVCQNARRAGALKPVGTERIAGSDRPAVVYERVTPGASAHVERAWHDALGSMMRMG